MATSVYRLVPATFVFAFALIAFVFSIVALTSKDWALQNQYDRDLSDLDWVNATYTRYRSPFKICNGVLINSTDTAATPHYSLNCTHFKAYGFDQTSCELAIATQSDGATNIGDARLCQQIHYAGNFGIASSAFMGLVFVLTLILIAHTLLRANQTSQPTSSPGAEGMDENFGERNENPQKEAASNIDRHPTRRQRKQEHSIFALVNLSLVTFVAIGAITALVSQFYGVLGLIQSLPNNSDFASSRGQDSTDSGTHGDHGPWYQGNALSIYMTCAWGFAIAAGTLASMTWSLPHWKTA